MSVSCIYIDPARRVDALLKEYQVEAAEVTSREFNRDSSGAKRKADRGPVFITDRGVRAHVLLSIQDYEDLVSHTSKKTLLQALAQPGAGEDIEFDPPRVTIHARDVDLG